MSLGVNTEGSNNTAVGDNSMSANTLGNSNTAYGINTLCSNTTGYNNTACGQSSLNSNITGSQNTGCGNASLSANTTGYLNTSCGSANALTNLTTGHHNSSFGGGNGGVSTNVAGNYNTYLGANTGCSTTGINNSTVVGYSASTTKSNQVILGTSTETTYIKGGFNMSLGIVSSTSTLGSPFLSNYLTSNGSTSITLTLPTPSDNGACVYIRRGVGATGLVTVNFSSIVAYNSTTVTTSVANGVSASYIYYNGTWLQESAF